MRYRKLDANQDMVFGGGQAAFFVDVPEAPAQAVSTRLKLLYGEWFLDVTDGTPWSTKVLGKYTGSTRDVVIKERVMGTQGVASYSKYYSYSNAQRQFFVQMQIDTIYGSVNIVGTL